MKKIITLALLAAGLTVVPGSNVADAYSGCGAGAISHFGVWDEGYAYCTYLAPGGEGPHGGEKVRAMAQCANNPGVWIYGPWVWTNNEQSHVTCTGEGAGPFRMTTIGADHGVGP